MADSGEPLFVGWVRTGWTHWEPVTLPPRPQPEARQALKAYERPAGDADGEKVLLPSGMHPDARKGKQKG